jgi:hypothetical protein
MLFKEISEDRFDSVKSRILRSNTSFSIEIDYEHKKVMPFEVDPSEAVCQQCSP